MADVAQMAWAVSDWTAGAILGAQRNLRTRPMIIGIVLGALPGLAMIFVMTRLAAPILQVASSLAGFSAGGAAGTEVLASAAGLRLGRD